MSFIQTSTEGLNGRVCNHRQNARLTITPRRTMSMKAKGPSKVSHLPISRLVVYNWKCNCLFKESYSLSPMLFYV